MASHQAHDIGFQKRKRSAPIRLAAYLRKEANKSKRREPPDWYREWLRTNRYPSRRDLAESGCL